MWNESILVKGAASCLYPGVTLSVHCVGEQSDSALLFQGLLRSLCSQIGVHVVSHYGVHDVQVAEVSGLRLACARTEGQFIGLLSDST